NGSAGGRGSPCGGLVPLATAGTLPVGYSPSLSVSIAHPVGYTIGVGSSFVAPDRTGRVTYSVVLSAAPLDGLRGVALAAIRTPSKLVADVSIDIRHEATSPRAASPLSPVTGVGTLSGYEVAAVGTRRGTFRGAVTFPLAASTNG